MADVQTTIRIAAIDQATEVVARVQSSVERMRASYAKLAGVLGVGVGVGAFVGLMKSTIDAADQMSKLSQKTGIAVEQLSALKYAANLSGVDTQTLARGVKGLSQQMIEAGDSTSKAARVFKALGVDISGGPMPTIEKLAGVFSKLQDGELKTTLATQIFGKAGMDLIPMLNQGADGIRKLEEEARRLGLTFTTETAKAAEEFNDNITAIKKSTEALGVSLFNQMAPALLRISKAMKDAAEDGGILNALLVGFGGVLKEGFGRSEQAELNARIVAYQKEILVYETKIQEARLEGLNVEGALTKQQEVRLAYLREELRLIQAAEAIRRYGTEDQNDRRMRQGVVLTPGPNEGAIRGALANGAPAAAGPSWFDRTAADAIARYQAALAELRNGVDRVTEAEKAWLRVKNSPEFQKQDRVTQLATEILFQEAIAVEQLLEVEKARLKAKKEAEEANARELQQLDEQIAALEKQVLYYGQSEAAVTSAAIAQLEYNKALVLANDEIIDPEVLRAYDLRIEKLTRIRDLQGSKETLEQLRAYEETQVRMWERVGGLVGDFFGDLVVNGRDAFSSLTQSLKRFAAEVVAFFAKRFVLQMVAGFAGGTAMGGAAELALGGMGNTMMGMAGSAAISYLGGAMSAGAGGMVGALGTGLAANVATLGVAMQAGAAAVGGMSSVMAAAIPVVGWIVALGGLLYAAFGRRGGGPKEGGSFFGDFSGGGALMGDITGTLDRRRHLHDETQLDSTAQQLSVSLASTIARTVAQLGGSPQAFQLGVGFNRDQAGTAPSMASLLLRDASGRVLLEQANRNVSRADGALEQEMSLQGQRAVLAALQASQLPREIADIINSLVAESASAEEIQRVLAAAMDMKAVLDNIGKLNIRGLDVEALRAWQREGETLSQTLQRVGGAFAQFDDAFMTEGQRLAAASRTVTDVFDQLGVAIPASSEDFYALVHSIDVSTEAGRGMVEQLLAVAPAFQTVERAAQAAVEQFYSLAAGMSGAMGQQIAQMNLTAAVGNWRSVSGTAWGNEEIIEYLRSIIANNTLVQHLPFIQSLGPQALPAFNAMLAAYQAWQQSLQAAPGNISPLTTGIGSLGSAAANAAEELARAKASLREYLDSLFIDEQLSPLSPTQRLDAARSQFDDLLARARTGDPVAMSQLSGASDAYLRIARELFASGSGYLNIFNQVTGQLASVSGYTGAAGGWSMAFEQALPRSSTLASSADLERLGNRIIAAIGGAAAANDEAVSEQTDQLRPTRAEPARR